MLQRRDTRRGVRPGRRRSMAWMAWMASPVVGLLVVALLGPAGVEARSVERPFTGWFGTLSSVGVAPPPGCQLMLETVQIGEAAHLGRFTGTGTTCGFNARVVKDPPFNLSQGAPPYFVSNFTIQQTWTLANGSTLTWTSSDGVFVQSLTDGSSSAIGTMLITGGSGEFEAASGRARVESLSTRDPRFGTVFDGVIAYDAAP